MKNLFFIRIELLEYILKRIINGDDMISYSNISKSGSRTVNEDYVSYARKDDKLLFILCDGLGGHGSGDIASETAARAFLDEFAKYDGDISLFYHNAYQRAQEKISELQQADESMSMMKTTLVSLLVDGNQVSWSHIGDSRLYFFKNGNLVLRTADHSVPQMLYRSGDISESEMRFHPDRNKLLRALGDSEREPQYTVSDLLRIEGEFAFILCSDGFWEYITEDVMEYFLSNSTNSEEWLGKMTSVVEKHNINKKSDNYSAIAVIIGEDS